MMSGREPPLQAVHVHAPWEEEVPHARPVSSFCSIITPFAVYSAMFVSYVVVSWHVLATNSNGDRVVNAYTLR